MKAQEEKIARLSKPAEQLRREARDIIVRARDATRVLMREGIIPPLPAGA
jgi:hypothetical protein